MGLKLKKQDNFIDLGTLKDFFNNYGKFDIAIKNEDSGSISLIINSEYGITTIVPCSRALSEIIIKKGGYFDEILLYRLLKIKNSSGNYYIRLSQNIDISYEEIEQENNNLKNLEGNVRTFVKVTQEMLDNQKKNVEKNKLGKHYSKII